MAPRVAALLHKASSSSSSSPLAQPSAQPPLPSFLQAEFVLLLDAWAAQQQRTLPPGVRQQGLAALARGWRAAQERYHLQHQAGASPPRAAAPAASSSTDDVRQAMAGVLPDPVSLVMVPELSGAVGSSSWLAWLSQPAPGGGSGSTAGGPVGAGGPEALPSAGEGHTFAMQQVLAMVASAGAERRVLPFPPAPQPGWLRAAALQVAAASRALTCGEDGAGPAAAAAPSGRAAVAAEAPHDQALLLVDLCEDGLAFLQSAVYMPLKDALVSGRRKRPTSLFRCSSQRQAACLSPLLPPPTHRTHTCPVSMAAACSWGVGRCALTRGGPLLCCSPGRSRRTWARGWCWPAGCTRW